MPELHDLTALEQATAVRERTVSSVELVTHYLDRVGRLSASLGAFVTVTADVALEQARAADEQVAAGGTLPPLLGVPTAIKDLNSTAGIRTTAGSALLVENVPQHDDAVVRLLRTAGTISLGKTNTPEFGLPCYTEPDIAPPARTPWDLDRSAGGSSGGAGAAVAAGLIPFAQGSDGGGSIRIPASVCGLFGIKTSRGRVSNGPLGNDTAGLGVIGPLARTVADAAAMLDAIAVPQPGDPHWAPPPAEPYLAQVGRDPGRLVIGRYVENILGAPVAPECLAAWDRATALLTDLGHEVVEVPTPDLGELYTSFVVLWSVGAASIPVPEGREESLRPLTRWLRETGRGFSGAEFLQAAGRLQIAARAHIAATAPYDAILTPTLAQLPAPVGGLRDDADPRGDFRAQGQFTPYTSIYNMTGQPAVSVPLHHTEANLPVGVQLVGRPADETTLIRLSAQLEAAAPWADRRPDCW